MSAVMVGMDTILVSRARISVEMVGEHKETWINATRRAWDKLCMWVPPIAEAAMTCGKLAEGRSSGGGSGRGGELAARSMNQRRDADSAELKE